MKVAKLLESIGLVRQKIWTIAIAARRLSLDFNIILWWEIRGHKEKSSFRPCKWAIYKRERDIMRGVRAIIWSFDGSLQLFTWINIDDLTPYTQLTYVGKE